MMVTFVSQCEKKSLNKTRRVLDAFANRIGNRTWQTVITNEGLIAVKKLLRKTASKNTAVSCHWIRSRSRSEFLWVVGNKDKFNAEGVVPVNYTQKDIEQYMDSNKWQTAEVIKYASAIAGLFHDFGKANILFQNKINNAYKPPKGETKKTYEPYRHEWLSLRLFQAFTEGKKDTGWLHDLSKINADTRLNNLFKDNADSNVGDNHPLENLAPFAKLVGWLVLTHHKLPLVPVWKENPKLDLPPLKFVDDWRTEHLEAIWNSYNCKDEDIQDLAPDNWMFLALPNKSTKWCYNACSLAITTLTKLQPWLDKDINWLDKQLFSAHLSRMSLIMADHYYSSQNKTTQKWRDPNYDVYANTYPKGHPQYREYKQTLDEHLIGVSCHAARISKALPKFAQSLESLDKNKPELTDNVGKGITDKKLKKDLKNKYGWQDTAKKRAEKLSKSTNEHGFFGINMASTGKGKTRANAKIMYALGKDTGRIRFNVAIGLRSLTLQTGKEFQEELNLNDDELAIAVGGSSVKQLFDNEQQKKSLEDENSTGSDSSEEYIDKDLYIYYKGKYKKHALHEWTKKNNRLEQLIQAPVLVSTIDHLMPACEGTKGGKQIAPMLRLLSADLVLDEPDDFGLDDLPALCRLVHWAAMLGSRVLLSTATMPPHLSNALFQAYQAGWTEYAKANIDDWNGGIVCAWFDEHQNTCKSEQVKDSQNFMQYHEAFVADRIKQLNKTPNLKRQGKIINVEEGNNTSKQEIINNIAATVQQSIFQLHQSHKQTNKSIDKTVSIGLVRMANINPLVGVAKELLTLEVKDKDTCIHYCIYHSHYPLAIRSHLENKLDDILNRKDINAIWLKENIQRKLKQSNKQHHIFVVLASPVAEVGRDHDYDWAIVEPSSMRSIIQLAGRILRHRDVKPKQANVHLLHKNYKALKANIAGEKGRCFEKPGFESERIVMADYDLNENLKQAEYMFINAIPRITMPKNIKPNSDNKFNNLVEMEHQALGIKFFGKVSGAKYWWKHYPHWCGEVQRQQPFRKSAVDESFYLCLEDKYASPNWQWKNEKKYPPEIGLMDSSGISIESDGAINLAQGNDFWFELNPLKVYSELVNDEGITANSLSEVSRSFGELRLVSYANSNDVTMYKYHDNLGLYKNID